MRRFKNITKSRQLELEKQFPNLMGGDWDDCISIGISTFDHVLTWDEFVELIDEASPADTKRRYSVFDSFNHLLIDKFDVLTFRYNQIGRKKLIFKGFTSISAAVNYLTHTDRENYQVVIPELNAVYYEGHDDCNCFYVDSEEAKEQVVSLLKGTGLHVLSVK